MKNSRIQLQFKRVFYLLTEMLSNFTAGHKVILIIDQNGHLERIAKELTASLTKNEPEMEVLPTPQRRYDTSTITDEELTHLIDNLSITGKSNLPIAPVYLIKVAEFVQLVTLPKLLHLVHKLKHFTNNRQIFLWVNEPCVLTAGKGAAIVPYLVSLADMAIRLRDNVNMSVVMKKSGGSIVKKLFSYEVSSEYSFDVRAVEKQERVKDEEPTVNPESLTTFKINVDDDEQEARTALKLPYERTSEIQPQEGRIIYHPDADDDFDEEDPDDDLNI